MKNPNNIKINMLMNMILSLSSFVFPLITFPYISRILLPEGTGKVSFAVSTVSYFSMLAQMGIPVYGIRACAKVRDNKKLLSKTVHELMFINIVMNVIAYIALFISVQLVPKFYQDRILIWVISCSIILTTLGMEWLYKALEQYTYITIRSIIFKLIAVVMMFVFVNSKDDYVIYGIITIIASSASFILNFVNANRFITVKHIGDYNLRQHIKPILIFFAMACATTIYTNLDTVMLGFMKSDIEVGYYNAAVKIKMILISVVTSLSAVILPRASYYVEKNMNFEFENVCKKAFSFVCIFSIPITVFFMMFAKEGIIFLSGDNYVDSVIPMQIMMPTIVFIGFSNIIGIQMLVPMGKEKIVLISEIVGAVVDFSINIVLIPQLASTGAAIGTLVAEFVVLSIQFIALRKQVIKVLSQISYIKIVISVCVGMMISLAVKCLNLDNSISLILAAILFGGCYLAILILLKEPLLGEFFEALKKKMNIKK